MEYLTQKLQSLKNIFVTRSDENIKREVSKSQLYFEHIYKILSWENPNFTLVVFLVLNFMFWLILLLQLNFFGIIFFVTLFAFLWDNYVEIKERAVYRGQYSEILDEICTAFKDIIFNLKALRNDNPSSFCIGMSLIFLFMNYIARNISGLNLLYLTFLVIFVISFQIKFTLPEEYVSFIRQILKSISTSKGVLAEEELIPFISNKDFTRKEADLDSLLTDNTADSATNSSISSMSTMPSYLDIAESRGGIEEDDLLPKNSQGGILYTPGELSSDSDSEHREIHFDSAHFNGDSSSEEENQLTKGLRFSSDMPDIQKSNLTANVGLGGVLSNFATIGGNLVANVLKSTVSNAPVERNSSSDSEFEVINTDDIDNL